MIEVIGQEVSIKKRITCRNCSSILSYLPIDIIKTPYTDEGVPIKIIKCPVCQNEIRVSS